MLLVLLLAFHFLLVAPIDLSNHLALDAISKAFSCRASQPSSKNLVIQR
jgi:hypothetical protein